MGVPAAGYTITPIVIDNVMYLPIQGTIIVALQADSGKELWKYDLKTLKDLGPNPSAGGRGRLYGSLGRRLDVLGAHAGAERKAEHGTGHKQAFHRESSAPRPAARAVRGVRSIWPDPG
jgi:hypothetical protein